MAILVHVVNVGYVKVGSDGSVLTKDQSANETIREHLNFSHDHRVLPNSNVPNSLNYPSVDEYINLESAADYVVHHIDQYSIITYKRDSGGGFPSS